VRDEETPRLVIQEIGRGKSGRGLVRGKKGGRSEKRPRWWKRVVNFSVNGEML